MVFDLPKNDSSIIKVIGVGGGGSNAVNHMFKQGIVGVDFAICNTDSQALEMSPVPVKIKLGPQLTEGRGAGSKPQVGKQACLESIEEIRQFLEKDTKMLFVTAGMGGGTGTGAAPIIAKLAKEMDILTVGIVTLPFTFEGRKRVSQGGEGLDELRKNVDTLIVISNDKLREIYGNLSLSSAFSQADDILTTAAKGIAEIITVPGYVNVDFEDVNTTMRGSGVAIMGTATAAGDDRARRAVDGALNSPLLEDNNIKGAQHILVNISSGNKEVTMDEIFEITEFVQEEAGFGTNLIWGNCFDESLDDELSVTIIATGFEHGSYNNPFMETAQNPSKRGENPTQKRVSLDDDEAKGISSPYSNAKKNSIFDMGVSGDNAKTYEFDVLKNKVEKYHRSSFSHNEPFIRDEQNRFAEEERRRMALKEAQRREQRLKSLNVKINNPQTINDLENQPAYMRRGINLDDSSFSNSANQDANISRWTIGEDEEPKISIHNSYLHDKAD